jgi:genome maintenance exonuclease 1
MTDAGSDSQWLPVYQAKSVRDRGQTFFVDQRGLRLPAVTTILNATRPPEDWERLKQWRDRVGHQEANQISSRASRRGTQTHKYLRRFLAGEAIAEFPDTVQPYWHSLEPVLEQVDAVRLVEGFVFHDTLGYGGKVDCIASYQGVPCLLDWKTADRPKGSVERLYDGPLQLAAYCGAVNQCYQEQGVKLAQAALIVAIAHQPAEVFWFDPDTLIGYWQQWQQRVEQFYHSR